MSLFNVLDGTAMNWCRKEDLRALMSETVLFGKIKDPELIVLNFSGQLQCRMGGKQEGPIEVYPKFWNLNPIAKVTREVLRIPVWTKCFEFTKRNLETILDGEADDAVDEKPHGSPFLHERATVETSARR